ncbi:MAG: methyltransferase domain-containing protein [Burkholderiales bacterium]
MTVAACVPVRAADENLKTGGPYVPTPQVVVDQMLRMAAVTENDYVIDLGSGDGVIVLTAARQFKASGMGVDIDPDLVKLSNASAQKFGVAARARFVREDVFKADLSKASVLTLYLLPDMMMNLRTKIFDELKPGTRIVSHDYHLGDWQPDDSISFDVPEKENVTGVPKATVMLWHVPARIAGNWDVKGPGGASYQLVLKQRFQSVDATATVAGKPVKVQAVTLRGNDFSFALPDGKSVARFSGRANGEAMEGTVDSPAGGKPAQRWTATRTAAAKVLLE